jgi:Enzyme involved in the deoxyxylulose pathway of isoprenoid biosynthesis
LKSSNPRVAIAAYRMLAARIKQEGFKPYPFHVGVTEAGAGADGRLKSAAGIGALLLDGLADTIRVSLTEDPVAEVPVAQELIKACALPAAPTAYNVPVLEKVRTITNAVRLNREGLGCGNRRCKSGEGRREGRCDYAYGRTP